jgi:hypothetical protein
LRRPPPTRGDARRARRAKSASAEVDSPRCRCTNTSA